MNVCDEMNEENDIGPVTIDLLRTHQKGDPLLPDRD